jgi:hypothetical protein
MRYYRSTREAFAAERHPAVFGPYKTTAHSRLIRTLYVAGTLAMFAGIGAILALGV